MNHLNLSIELNPFDRLTNSYFIESNVNTCVSSDGDRFIIPDLSIIFPVEPIQIVSPFNGNMISISHFKTQLAPLGSQATDEDPNIIMSCFKIGNNTHYIPNKAIINDFLFPRPLSSGLIDDAAEIYELPEKLCLEMKGMIDEKNTSKSWSKIAKILEKRHYDEDLYRIFSLRSYQKTISVTFEESIDSLLTFVDFSNFAVLQVMNEIDNPSPSSIIINDFCQSNGISYELVQYQESVRKYFDMMLPMPLNFISNLDKDKELNSFFIDSVGEYEHHPNREVIFPDKLRQKEYMQRISRSEKIRRLLFPNYYRTISWLYTFWDRLDADRPEVNREILNQNRLNQKGEKNTQPHSQDKNPIEERCSALHQCQFCTMFSMMELKLGQNEPAHHCGRPQCKRTYGTWIRGLNRKGYKLRDPVD